MQQIKYDDSDSDDSTILYDIDEVYSEVSSYLQKNVIKNNIEKRIQGRLLLLNITTYCHIAL